MDLGGHWKGSMSATDRRDTIDAAAAGEDLPDVLRKHGRNLELELRVHMPATIVSFNAATQTATVLAGFLMVEDQGVEIPDQPIQISNVRVEFPRSAAGTCFDTWPIVPGDTGILSFHDRALDEWYRKGGAVDPIDARAHSLADATWRPCLAPDATALSAVDATARVIEHATLIKIGKAATAFAAKADLVLTELTALYNHALTHTHPHAMGPTGVAVPPPTAPASVAAVKVKVQ
jgi:hypothetical protein